MRKDRWNTYKELGYSGGVVQDQDSAGGIMQYQVRRGPAGWQERICQRNGKATSYGGVAVLSDANGEAKFAQALEF